MRELIYFADPMCSWCFGFEPEFQYVGREHDLPVRLVMGGLFPGDRAPALDEGLRDYLRHTWAKVSEMSGQTFNMTFIERASWVYNTEPSCRAVVTMRAFAPERILDFFYRLQHAFYEHAQDVTQLDAITPLLEGFGVSADAFTEAFNSDAMKTKTVEDFAFAHRLGVQGFPTVFLRSGSTHTPVARGYRRGVDVSRSIEVMLNLPATAAATEP